MQENIACDTVRKKKSTTFNLTAFHINGRMITEVHFVSVFFFLLVYIHMVFYICILSCAFTMSIVPESHMYVYIMLGFMISRVFLKFAIVSCLFYLVMRKQAS